MRAALPCLAIALLCGCARAKSPADARGAVKAPAAIRVDPIVIHGRSTADLLADLERARSLLLIDKPAQAAADLDRLFAETDDPALKALAAYHAGLAYEAIGKRSTALDRYRTVSDQLGGQSIATNALVRATRLLGYLERWPEQERTADELLARPDLPLMDRIEGLGAKALAAVEQGRIEDAAVAVGKADGLIDKNGFDQGGQPPAQLAQVSFAEGELRRLNSERIQLTPAPENFLAVLEARCEGLLSAQAAYIDAMRAKDAHWSAMSGFRVGELYTRLHTEVMAIPPPAKAKTQKDKQLFEGAMLLRYRILLEKGLKMMDATVRLGDRTGEDSEWVARARESKKQLEQALADEKAALAQLPFSEDELKAALETLKRRADKH